MRPSRGLAANGTTSPVPSPSATPSARHWAQQQLRCRRPLARRGRHPVAAAPPETTAAPSSSSTPTPVTTSSSSPRPVYLDDAPTRGLVDWARGVGIQGLGNKVKVASFGGVRGLAAAAAQAESDILLSVPRSVAITLPPKRRCPEGVPQQWWDRDAPWYARLAALLLVEKRRVAAAAAAGSGGGGGGNSGGNKASSQRPLMGPYLATLPQSYPEMPYFWTDAQLEELRYPALQQAVREQRREWKQLHDAWVKEAGAASAAAASSSSSSSPSSSSASPPILFTPSFSELEWAMSTVRSRTFSGPYVASTLASRGRLAGLVGFLAVGSALFGGADAESLGRAVGAAAAAFIFNILYETILSNKLKQYVLCPAIDLLNHDSRSGSEASYDYFRDSFSVAAGLGGAAAEKQVFGSYGSQSNDSLAQYYGFAERENPADAYVLTRLVGWAEEATGIGAGKLVTAPRRAALEAAALLPALDRDAKVTRDGKFPDATLQAMRYLLAEAAAPGGSTGKAVSAFESAGSADEEGRLAAVLAAAVRLELERGIGPATAEEDERALMELDGRSGGGGGFVGGGVGSGTSSSKQGRRGGGGGAATDGGGGGGAAAAARRLALQFRAEKKKVLSACLDSLVGGGGGGGV
jgi:hypothetical protein